MKWLYLVLVSCLAACTGGGSNVNQWMNNKEQIRVLSTVGMVDDLVREVGGEQVTRLVLIDGSLDPHHYELVKGDDEKLQCADVIFYSGLGLEHGPSLCRYLRESDLAVGVGDAIVRNDPRAVVRLGNSVDPHIWMDVSLWMRGTEIVAEVLSSIDPANAHLYQERAEKYKDRLCDLDTELRAQLSKVPLEKRFVVTSHDSCNYFSRRYLATNEERNSGAWKERCTSPEGLSPEAQLSTLHIKDVVNHLIAYNIEVIFPESNLSQDSIKKLVDAGKKRGLAIQIAEEPLYGDAMGEVGSDGDTYEKMMRHNARVLMEWLNHG